MSSFLHSITFPPDDIPLIDHELFPSIDGSSLNNPNVRIRKLMDVNRNVNDAGLLNKLEKDQIARLKRIARSKFDVLPLGLSGGSTSTMSGMGIDKVGNHHHYHAMDGKCCSSLAHTNAGHSRAAGASGRSRHGGADGGSGSRGGSMRGVSGGCHLSSDELDDELDDEEEEEEEEDDEDIDEDDIDEEMDDPPSDLIDDDIEDQHERVIRDDQPLPIINDELNNNRQLSSFDFISRGGGVVVSDVRDTESFQQSNFHSFDEDEI